MSSDSEKTPVDSTNEHKELPDYVQTMEVTGKRTFINVRNFNTICLIKLLDVHELVTQGLSRGSKCYLLYHSHYYTIVLTIVSVTEKRLSYTRFSLFRGSFR